MRSWHFVALLAVPWFAASAMATAKGQAAGRQDGVVIDGSSTVFRISRAAQESFSRVRGDVTVVVNVSGTSGGFRSYLSGKCDIVDASRPASKAEESRAQADPALAWTRFLVGYDGITVVVNPKNEFVNSLTVEQLRRLWEPDGESKVRTWQDLDPVWPPRRIVFYCPDSASGTFDYFSEKIVGKEKLQRKDVQASPNDDALVRGVAGDPDAIGYFGYAYYAANRSKLRAVPVQADTKSKAVMPAPATILDESYAPLSRPLYLYANNASLKRPEVVAFLGHYLDKIGTLATKGGYVPPKQSDIEANGKAYAAATGGAAR